MHGKAYDQKTQRLNVVYISISFPLRTKIKGEIKALFFFFLHIMTVDSLSLNIGWYVVLRLVCYICKETLYDQSFLRKGKKYNHNLTELNIVL